MHGASIPPRVSVIIPTYNRAAYLVEAIASVRAQTFADWELIGVPHRIVLSDRGLKAGALEYQGRRDTAPTSVPVDDVLAFVKGKLAA